MNLDLEEASNAQLKEFVLLLLERVQLLEQRVRELEAENDRLRQNSGSNKPPSFVKPNRAKRERATVNRCVKADQAAASFSASFTRIPSTYLAPSYTSFSSSAPFSF